MGDVFYEVNRKVYESFASVVGEGEISKKIGYSRMVNTKGSAVPTVSRASVYDSLFGALSVSDRGPMYYLHSVPYSYYRLATAVVSSYYLSSPRWQGGKLNVDIGRWVSPDVSAGFYHNRYVTKQMRGLRGVENRGYDLPEPIPLSQMVFEDFGVNPLDSAREFIYTKDDIERIFAEGWYPREFFKGVMSLGGYETSSRGVAQYVVEEDFVPRVPITFSPYDRALFVGIRKLLKFLDEVWENPDVLDEYVKKYPIAVYSRVGWWDGWRSFPVILPELGVSWGDLFYFMNWYSVSRRFSGYLTHDLHAAPTDSRLVESALATVHVVPAVSGFRMGPNVFRTYIPGTVISEGKAREMLGRGAYNYGPFLMSVWRLMKQYPDGRVLPLPDAVRFLQRFSYGWFVGFGLIRYDPGTQKYYFGMGDPMYWAMHPTSAGRWIPIGENFWFNYQSISFFEVMRKFVFLALEMLRRYGDLILADYRASGDGVVEVVSYFSNVHDDGPFSLLTQEEYGVYEGKETFLRYPFYLVFNMGMSMIPAVLYADSGPFRAFYQMMFEEVVHVLSDVDPFVQEYYYTMYGYVPFPTYTSVSKSLVLNMDEFARVSGQFVSGTGLYSNFVSMSGWYSARVPGVHMVRVPFYDPITYEAIVEKQLDRHPLILPMLQFDDYSLEGRYFAWYDDSTDRFVPVAEWSYRRYDDVDWYPIDLVDKSFERGVYPGIVIDYIAHLMRKVARYPFVLTYLMVSFLESVPSDRRSVVLNALVSRFGRRLREKILSAVLSHARSLLSWGRSFSDEALYSQGEELVRIVREACPSCF